MVGEIESTAILVAFHQAADSFGLIVMEFVLGIGLEIAEKRVVVGDLVCVMLEGHGVLVMEAVAMAARGFGRMVFAGEVELAMD